MNVRTAAGLPRYATLYRATSALNLRHVSSSTTLYQSLELSPPAGAELPPPFESGPPPSVQSIRAHFLQPTFNPATPPVIEHGRHIYVFCHIQTNQVVYSLTRAMNNNAALEQLPFNGKKTVPSALRKDLWHPMATISFLPGAGAIGLSAFQKLREYRRLHELTWDKSLMWKKPETDKEQEKGDRVLLTKKKRGRQIMDQKANSVADIAAVLGKIGTPEGAAVGLMGSVPTRGDATQVEIRWSNLVDAEFAETWSENVIHDKLDWSANNREILNLPSSQIKRLKEGAQILEMWKAMEPEKKKELAMKGFGRFVRQEKERKLLRYQKDQAERRAKWLASGGVKEELSLEEQQEREAQRIHREAAKEQDLAHQESLREEQRIAKLALKEEKRLAYEADQAARREKWLATLTPEEADEVQRRREEREIARQSSEDINLPTSMVLAERKQAREQRSLERAAELRKRREARTLAKKVSRRRRSAHTKGTNRTLVAEEEARKQAEYESLDFRTPYPTPEERTQQLRKTAELQNELLQKIRDELVFKATAARTAGHLKNRDLKMQKDKESNQQGRLSSEAEEERRIKREEYEVAQAKSREEWIAAGSPVRPKAYVQSPPKSSKVQLREEKRLAYEKDQAMRKAERIAAGSPTKSAEQIQELQAQTERHLAKKTTLFTAQEIREVKKKLAPVARARESFKAARPATKSNWREHMEEVIAKKSAKEITAKETSKKEIDPWSLEYAPKQIKLKNASLPPQVKQKKHEDEPTSAEQLQRRLKYEEGRAKRQNEWESQGTAEEREQRRKEWLASKEREELSAKKQLDKLEQQKLREKNKEKPLTDEQVRKRLAYEKDQARRKREWEAQGTLEERARQRKEYLQSQGRYPPPDEKKKVRKPATAPTDEKEKVRKRLAYEEDQARCKREWEAQGTPEERARKRKEYLRSQGRDV